MEEEINEESFKAVKMTLNTFCYNTDLKLRINEFILNANKITFWEQEQANVEPGHPKPATTKVVSCRPTRNTHSTFNRRAQIGLL